MAEIDTAEIREHWAAGRHCDVCLLCDEIDRLRDEAKQMDDEMHVAEQRFAERLATARADALEEAAKTAKEIMDRRKVDNNAIGYATARTIYNRIRALAASAPGSGEKGEVK